MKCFAMRIIVVLFFMNFALSSPLKGSSPPKALREGKECLEKQANVRNFHLERYPYAVQTNGTAGMVSSGSHYVIQNFGKSSEKTEAMNAKIRSFYQNLQAELQDGRISYDQFLARLACWYADPGRNPCAALSADGALAAISCWIGDITIYDAKTGVKKCVLNAPKTLPSGFILPKMQFSDDGNFLVVLVSRSNAPDEFFIYETKTGNLRQKIRTPRFLFFPSGKVRMFAEDECYPQVTVCSKDADAVLSEMDFSLHSLLEAGMPWNLPAVTDSVQKEGRFVAMSENALVYAMDVPRQMKTPGGFMAMDTPLVGIVCCHDLSVPEDVSFVPIMSPQSSASKTLMNPVYSETLNSFLFTTNKGDVVKLPCDTRQAEFLPPQSVLPATAASEHTLSYPYPQYAATFTSTHGIQIQCGLPRFRIEQPDGTVEEHCAPRKNSLDELFPSQTAFTEKLGEEILFVQKIQSNGLQTLRALFPGTSRRVVSTCLTSDGRYAAAGIQNMEENLETGYVTLWDVQTGKELATSQTPQKSGTFHQIQFTPDDKTLVVLALSCGNQKCTLLRIDVSSGKVLQKIPLQK